MYREDIEMLWLWTLFVIPYFFLVLPLFYFGIMSSDYGGLWDFLGMLLTFHFIEALTSAIEYFASYYLWLLDAIIYNIWVVPAYIIIVLATIIYFLITAKKEEESSSSNV